MITKNHYRMYKKGKMWVWGLITFSTTFTVIGSKNVLANADVNNSNNNVNNVCSDSNVSNYVQTNQVTLQKQNISNNSVSQQSNFVNKNSENQVSNVNSISSSNLQLNNNSKNNNSNVQLNNNPLVKVDINGSSYIRSENSDNNLRGFQHIDNKGIQKTYYCDPNNGQILYGQQKIDNHWYLFGNDGSMLTGFQYIPDQNKTCYYDPNNGQMLYGLQQINNDWYLFDVNSGAMLTGQQNVDGWRYFDDKTGKEVVNRFQYINGQNKVCYYGNDGIMLYGHHCINNKWYYFDYNTGAILTGWQDDPKNGKTYYLNPSGWSVSGQQKLNNHWYLFGNDGSMLTGFQYIPDQNKTCYYSLLNGQMQYGLQNINNHWYLFDPNDGSMQCGERYYANGWRYFDQNGQEVINNFVDQNGKRYFYDQNGIKKFGVQYVNDHLRYFDPITGVEYLNGIYNVDGNDYVFDTNGYLVSSNVSNDGQVKINGCWYLLDNGFVKTGFQYVPDQNKTCYYDPNSGQMLYGQQHINGHWYLFDQNSGSMLTGFQYIPDQNKTCYYDPNSGQMLYGQQHINGHWYLFDQNSGSMLTGFQYVPGQNKTCYYDPSNGQMLYGWQKINGHTYYFDVNTGSMYVGTQTINGKQYHFDSNGEESPIINFRNLYGSHLDFVNSLINGAIQGWNEYGILPSVTIAQSILESGWGQSYLSTAAHNLFGIKGSYNGQSIILPTKEWNGYEYVTINDSFRRYDNNSESVADHGYFLTINSRYNNLHWQRDYHTVCELLQQDGYATAPTYASSLINIIDCYGLNSVDQSLF